MKLTNYINDLLYRYDCVIVPGFGGFVTNSIGASIDINSHTFYPPNKQISFNSHLKHNDGLLANYIASVEDISFEKATTAISLSVIKWKNKLQSEKIELENLGCLSLNSEKKFVFEPITTVNFLTTSYGLATLESSSITRLKESVLPLPIVKEERKIPTFIKYAATAAILLTLGFAGFTSYQEQQQQQKIANQKEALDKKIQSATFIISNPLPTIELNVVKEKEIRKPYHIIAGAFQFEKNAEKKVKQLQKKGYNATIVGINKWGLTQVAFESYANKNKAINVLYKIQKSVSKDAWLLID